MTLSITLCRYCLQTSHNGVTVGTRAASSLAFGSRDIGQRWSLMTACPVLIPPSASHAAIAPLPSGWHSWRKPMLSKQHETLTCLISQFSQSCKLCYSYFWWQHCKLATTVKYLMRLGMILLFPFPRGFMAHMSNCGQGRCLRPWWTWQVVWQNTGVSETLVQRRSRHQSRTVTSSGGEGWTWMFSTL